MLCIEFISFVAKAVLIGELKRFVRFGQDIYIIDRRPAVLSGILLLWQSMTVRGTKMDLVQKTCCCRFIQYFPLRQSGL